ncbi:MAG: hypothetical protein NC086_02445 [Alistipes sp.]|nr:hypothetical protein [Alistipes sp.]
MSEYFSLFRKEWQVYLKKELIKFMCFFLCGAAAGFLLLYFVLKISGGETTYIYLMSIMAMVFAGFGMFLTGHGLSVHFFLGVSMGQKRKDLIVSAMMCCGVLTLAGYAAVSLLLLFEKNVYPVLFAGIQAEGEMMAPWLWQWGLFVIAAVVLMAWFFFVLSMRFGSKVFWIPYLLYMTLMLFGRRFLHNGSGRALGKILFVMAGFSPAVWILLCVVFAAFLILIGSRILMRLDVK